MRDIVSNMCEELMSDVLPILVPTANNVANVEPNADCFTLNPKAEQPFVLQKILFLGYLLGWSLYQFGSFGLDLPLQFWKRVTHGPEYVYSIEDLKALDNYRG